MITHQNPLKLYSNRVWRTYKGGCLLEEWQHKPHPIDGDCPEEWVASVTQAYNPGRESIADEGLSFVEIGDGRKITLRQLIETDPNSFLGKQHVQKYGTRTAVLIKMLDSAERLTIQVHPDRSTAKNLFQSDFGKTEAWYILGGREVAGESPYVLLGFKPGITREKWCRLFETQDFEGMIAALHKFPVQPGQVFLIEGGTPHAIGPGCFILEIQEPTDYTIRVEKKTPSGLPVPDKLCHQGLGFDKMFDCFHYYGYTEEEILWKWRIEPHILRQSNTAVEKMLIVPKNTPFFSMREVEVFSSFWLEKSRGFSAIIILSGDGVMEWDGGSIPVHQGEQFFIPAAVGAINFRKYSRNPLRIIRCMPPG